jgi:hypothetical protein
MIWSLGTVAGVVDAVFSVTGRALQNGSVPARKATGTGRLGVFVSEDGGVNKLIPPLQGSDRPRSGQGGEPAFKQQALSLPHTAPPDLGFASATLS